MGRFRPHRAQTKQVSPEAWVALRVADRVVRVYDSMDTITCARSKPRLSPRVHTGYTKAVIAKTLPQLRPPYYICESTSVRVHHVTSRVDSVAASEQRPTGSFRAAFRPRSSHHHRQGERSHACAQLSLIGTRLKQKRSHPSGSTPVFSSSSSSGSSCQNACRNRSTTD